MLFRLPGEFEGVCAPRVLIGETAVERFIVRELSISDVSRH